MKAYGYWTHSPDKRRWVGMMFCTRLLFGRINSMYVRTWNLGPFSLVISDLDRP